MSSNPDPQPEKTTGLEPGGGVPPGETPPDSGSVDAEPARHDTQGGPGKRTATPWVVGGLLLLMVAFVVAFLVGRLFAG